MTREPSSRSDVHVLKTSPASLQADVARLLETAPARTLDPARATWIKVNGNFNVDYPGSNTSRWFLAALLGGLRDRGFRDVTIVEGDLPEFHAEDMARATGLEALAARFGVPFRSYESSPRDLAELPRELDEVQLVNAPVFHTHGQATISCATKNLVGLLPWDRRKYHKHLSAKLLELRERVPCVTLVDGTVGLEGESTRRGDPVQCDVLIAGRDPITIDVVAAWLMGFDPESIPLLSAAAERSLVDFGRITVRGDFQDLGSVPRRPFTLRISPVRKIANLLSHAPVSLEPLYFVTDRLRVLLHKANFKKKQRGLVEGPWMEYAARAGEPVTTPPRSGGAES
ncbi:MAG: DUF362 domain-containing protein [Polyangiaceae bacterium]